MDIGSAPSKLLSGIASNAGKIGLLAGFFTGTPNGINDTISTIDNLMRGNIHPPDLGGTFQAIANEPYVKNALFGWIAGEIVDVIDPPLIGKYAKAIKDASIGYGLGAVAIKVAWMSTHADEGSNPMAPNYNPDAWKAIYKGSSPSQALPTNGGYGY